MLNYLPSVLELVVSNGYRRNNEKTNRGPFV